MVSRGWSGGNLLPVVLVIVIMTAIVAVADKNYELIIKTNSTLDPGVLNAIADIYDKCMTGYEESRQVYEKRINTNYFPGDLDQRFAHKTLEAKKKQCRRERDLGVDTLKKKRREELKSGS